MIKLRKTDANTNPTPQAGHLLHSSALLTWLAVLMSEWFGQKGNAVFWFYGCGLLFAMSYLWLHVADFQNKAFSAAQPVLIEGWNMPMVLLTVTSAALVYWGGFGLTPALYVIVGVVLYQRLPRVQLFLVLLALNTLLLFSLQKGAGLLWSLSGMAAYLGFQMFGLMLAANNLALLRSNVALNESNAALQATRALLVETERANERLKLSRELHDVCGHKLTALKLTLRQLVLKQQSGSTEPVLKQQSGSTEPVLKQQSGSTENDLKQQSGSTEQDLKQQSGSDEKTLKQPAHALLANESNPQPQDSASLQLCQQLADELLSDIRQVVSALRLHDGVELHQSLQALAQAWSYPKVQADVEAALKVPDFALAQCMLRVAQEALTNAALHGQASLVQISLQEQASTYEISIRDNGKGKLPFKPGNGVTGMQERVALAQGQLQLLANADRDAGKSQAAGITVRAIFPKPQTLETAVDRVY